MQILYAGELEYYARSNQRFRALRELGHEVTGISTVPSGPGPRDGGPIVPRVFSKIGLPLDPLGVNRQLLEHAGAQRFDLVWIEKGLMVRPTTLRQIKRLQPQIVFASYTEDDMFARHNQSFYYRRCVPLYDVVFTTKSYNRNPDELPSLGARRVEFVDKAFDTAIHRPLPVSPEINQRFGGDVGFIGSFEQSRAEQLLHIAETGVGVRVWGNGWATWVGKHPLLRVENRPLYGDDYVTALCATKINMCFLRKANRDLQTDRTMEIPACGAFMLAERTPEHQRLFLEDVEAAYFNVDDTQELISKVTHYLRHDAERDRIAAAARRRCLSSGYSHHERLQAMLSTVGLLGRESAG